MKKYLLIESQNLRNYYIPFFEINIPADVVQPLGLIQLASIIKARDPLAHVKILDLRLLKNDFSTLAQIVKDYGPDFIGFRGVSRDAVFMADMVKMMRYLVPGAVLVGGGPHVSAAREKVMKDAPLDYAVYSEGELALPALIDAIEGGGAFQDVPNLIWRDKDRNIVVNPLGPYVSDLDRLPMPSWELLDHEQYFAMNYYPQVPINLNARRELVSIMTSRGCPYQCIFCHNIFGKKFRARSPGNVVDEIEHLYKNFGIRQFDFRDDIFNLDKQRVLSICELIIERGLDLRFSFPNGLRADIMDEELVLAMKKAGLYRLNYALETASPRLQRMTKKNINLEKLRAIMRFTSAQGILTNLFVMLGFPTETREEMMMTVEFSLDPALDFIHTFTVNPFEGTEMAEMLRTEGVNVEDFRKKYDYFAVEYSICELARDEVEALRSDLLKRFFTPERITRTTEKLKAFA
ncbi:MAG: radical SAM protein [Candidatus Eremiobacteraeota bacterium]|nr:radical SAM protein [Candidatus Eremiobacteraeota bacterium]